MPKGVYVRTKKYKEKISKIMLGNKKLSESRKKYFREHPEARQEIADRNKKRVPSKKLKATWKKIGLKNKKEKNPNWKGGISPLRKLLEGTSKYRKWREKIFKRDDYTCQDCGNSGGELHAHHIKSFAEFPELRLDLDNGLTLCKKCHYKNHSKKARELLKAV